MRSFLSVLILAALGSCLPATQSWAYTEVEMVDRKGRPTRLVIENGWARGTSHASDYIYALINLREQRLYLVDMGEKSYADVSDVFLKGQRAYYGLQRVGAGPTVGGRPTTEYQVSDIDDQMCARIFLWDTPPEEDLRLLQALFANIKVHPEALLPVLGPLAQGLISPCVRAELDALGELSRQGLIAMRINQYGQTTLKIHAVRTEGKIEDCMMKLPSHYRIESPPMLAIRLLSNHLFGRREKPPTPLTLQCP